MNYAGKPIVKGVLFLSSMKCQENVEQIAMLIKVQCAKENILVEDVAVEHNPIGDMDIDRPSVKAIVNTVAGGAYDVLILRNLYDVTEDEADWEQFLNTMADLGVQVYAAETGMFVFNNYEEC